MARKQIEIKILQDGSVEAEAIGFKGKSCDAGMKFLEKALGKKVSGKKKPEYQSNTTHDQSLGGGK